MHAVEVSGLLGLVADALVAATGGHLPAAAYAILWGSALFSAIIDNIPFVATMIPVVKGMAPAYGGMDKIEPLWWSLSLGACLGGNATLVGASANLLVAGLGERYGVPFRFVSYIALRLADDDRFDRDLPRVSVVALFLRATTLPACRFCPSVADNH